MVDGAQEQPNMQKKYAEKSYKTDHNLMLISGRLGIVQSEVEAVLALLWREQHNKVFFLFL